VGFDALIQVIAARDIDVEPGAAPASLEGFRRRECVVFEDFIIQSKSLGESYVPLGCKTNNPCVFAEFSAANAFPDEVRKTERGLRRSGRNEDVGYSSLVS